MRNLTPTTPIVPDFTPVPRKYRYDGWTAERQRAFIDALADTGSVTAAAKRINMSSEGAYYLRRQPGAEEFRAAWAAALDHGLQRLADIAIDRALNGVAVPIFWRGEQVGEKRWYNDKLLMFLLKHHLPCRYGRDLKAGTKHPETRAREKTNAEMSREKADNEPDTVLDEYIEELHASQLEGRKAPSPTRPGTAAPRSCAMYGQDHVAGHSCRRPKVR